MMYNNMTETKMSEAEKQEISSLRRLNYEKCYLGILWLTKKLEELGCNIEDPEKFKEDLIEQIKGSWKKVQSAAVLSSAETLFNVKHGKTSLRNIFERHGINVGKYVFCLTITEQEVIVSDGFGAPRKRVRYNNGKFSYDLVKGLSV